MTTDKRRYGVIEVRRRNMSPRDRRADVVRVGENRDVETGIRLAKRMIVDGRMPTPEEALASLESSGGARKASADDVRELIEALIIKAAGSRHCLKTAMRP